LTRISGNFSFVEALKHTGYLPAVSSYNLV